MIGWHHRLNGHEFEQALGDGEGQGSLACCSSWGRKEPDMTGRLNNNKVQLLNSSVVSLSSKLFFYFVLMFDIKDVPQMPWLFIFIQAWKLKS